MSFDDQMEDNASDPLEADASELPVGEQSGEAEDGTQQQVEGGEAEAVDGQTPTPKLTGLEGTPFKDVPAIVKGYKDLQRLVASRDQQLQILARNLDILASKMQQAQPGQKAPQTLTGDQLLEALVNDPDATIGQLIEKAIEAKFGSRLGKIEQGFQGISTTEEVNTFVRQHPDLTEADEDEMVAIMQKNPQWRNLPVAEQLDRAYDKVYATRFRAGTARQANRDAVSGAKGVAALGGKKTTIPAQTPTDAFDDVLALDKSERDVFKLGKR